jgi:hypothetical protein
VSIDLLELAAATRERPRRRTSSEVQALLVRNVETPHDIWRKRDEVERSALVIADFHEHAIFGHLDDSASGTDFP